MVEGTVSHYHIAGKLGGGGMGIVYRADDLDLGRTVALKFLPPHLSADDEANQRFVAEAKAASALDHPNICTIYEIGRTDEGQRFIAMAYYDGETLKHRIERGPLPVEEAVDLAAQMAEGLARAHEADIVHRDVKPANVMVTDRGRAKILDFGIAKVSGSHLTNQDSTVGTIAYMSPEQTKGSDVDARTDVWSLGVVLYEMLTGKRPFDAEFEQAIIYRILNEQPAPLVEQNPAVPPALAAIVERAMAKDRAARYASMSDLLGDLRALQEAARPVVVKPLWRQPTVLIVAGLMLLALAAFAVWQSDRRGKQQWAREEALPEVERLVNESSFEGGARWVALELAAEAERYVPGDPLLESLYPRFSKHVWIVSDPPGAQVFVKPYGEPDAPWRSLGTTPTDSLRLPRTFARIKLEMEGHRTVQDLLYVAGWLSDTLHYILPEAGSIPDEMERLPASADWYEHPAAPSGLHLPGLEQVEPRETGDFLMDRHEVTNADFKSFVDAGGYRNQEFWTHPFVEEDRTLSWTEAMARFVDKTGQPGPATWEVGDYADGQDDYPVGGVSWYEAAAYAEFAGKSLPTIYHWDRAASTWSSPAIVPLSNLNADGPQPVGASASMNRLGIYDLAGNVREWTFNATDQGERFILGGGWSDPTYAFNDAYAQSPFDRSPTNGFRTIRYLDTPENLATLQEQIELPSRDFLNEPQVSDETFALFLDQYRYDKTPLNARVEATEEFDDWFRERITFDAAYGGERMMAYLFLPKQGTPPYQTVVYFPGSNAIHLRSSEDIQPWDFFLKDGRAFLYPIYKGTFERGDDLHSDYADETNFYKEHVIAWAKDLGRSVDYLETRDDIDADRLAYFGASWGGAMGGIMLAVEPRFEAAVLLVAGLVMQRAQPVAEPLHFLPRIEMPVLMLNGQHDFFFPYETAQLPFFELLGTPDEHKQILIEEGGHSFPQTRLVKESLAWLDRYLGPVDEGTSVAVTGE